MKSSEDHIMYEATRKTGLQDLIWELNCLKITNSASRSFVSTDPTTLLMLSP